MGQHATQAVFHRRRFARCGKPCICGWLKHEQGFAPYGLDQLALIALAQAQAALAGSAPPEGCCGGTVLGKQDDEMQDTPAEH